MRVDIFDINPGAEKVPQCLILYNGALELCIMFVLLLCARFHVCASWHAS